MVRRGDQEGAGFLSNPVRGGNNDIPAPNQQREVKCLYKTSQNPDAHANSAKWERTMKIREIMTETVELVDPDTALCDAAQRMRDVSIGFLPVGVDDRLVGTLTDRDITVRAVADGLDPKVARVREAMSRTLIYCFEDQDTSEAATLMAENKVRRLPVLNSAKRLVGVISIGDLAVRTGDDDVVGQTVQDISGASANS
jgi:CBS domain-containing protein